MAGVDHGQLSESVDSVLRRDLNAHVGRLDHGIDHDSRGEVQFVGRLTGDEGDETVGTRLDLHLRHNLVLDNFRHDSDKPIARRLGARLIGRLLARDVDGQCGEIGPVEIPTTVLTDGDGDAARVSPTTNGVGAHAQQFGRLSYSVSRHDAKVNEWRGDVAPRVTRRRTSSGILRGVAKVIESIDSDMADWLCAQPVFFVATAPRSDDGHVNCSPKGNRGEFAVLDPHRVAYLDQTGSGVETISHLNENGRIVVMFCAFSGPPRIVRLHGTGRVVPASSDEFAEVVTLFDGSRGVGVRSVVVIDVTRIADSCGYGVPFMTFESHRPTMDQWSTRKGHDGIREYQNEKNRVSIDGLDGLAPA